MALLEKEAIRFADSLSDYEHVSVVDMGGWGPTGYWVVVRDHRFGLDYEISSHCDYWDFIGALVDHKQYIAPPVQRCAASSVYHEGSDDPDKHGSCSHHTSIEFHGSYATGTARLELTCETCGHIATTSALEEAEALARLHEHFEAELIATWEVK